MNTLSEIEHSTFGYVWFVGGSSKLNLEGKINFISCLIFPSKHMFEAKI